MIEMKELFRGFKKKPVAFIGSGISKRYMDTPTWEQLLKKTISEYNPNPSHYGHLMLNNNHDLELVASLIQQEYDDYFYMHVATDKKHKDYPLYLEYKDAIDAGIINPYKIYTSKVFLNSSTNDAFENEKELFKKMLSRCSNIITTNYDALIENNTSFKKVIGSKSFINDQCIGFGELYKIHGCCTDPNSIVITKKDYEEFNKKQSFYHAKLLLSFVEKPIIFLGYSISDKYIQRILEDVSENLNDNEINNLASRLIFIEYDETAVKPDKYIKQISKVNMTCIRIKDFSVIYKIISDNINVGIPLELVRMFQEAVKNFVYEQDNPDALAVKGVEDIKDISGLTAFHIGIKPVSDNLSLVKIPDLITDVLYDNCAIGDYNRLVEILNDPKERSRFQFNAYIPVYKILKRSSKYKDVSIFKGRKIIGGYKDIIVQNNVKRVNNIEELKNKLILLRESKENNTILVTLIVNIDLIDGLLLREQLTFLFENDDTVLDKSEFRKLVCYLDYLENK